MGLVLVAVGFRPFFEEDRRVSPTVTRLSLVLVAVGLGLSIEEDRRFSPTVTKTGCEVFGEYCLKRLA